MFENLSLLQLQEYWWFIIALLGGLLVFMTFVQGGQTILYKVTSNEEERDVVVNLLGRKWELTFTTLVLFGGALFAAFPLIYSVSFGGAYYLWMAILFCFIIQAVSYEYRKKPDNILGEKTFELFLYINGSIGIFLIGVAVGALFTGGHFVRNDMNLSHWTTPYYGLEAILNPFNFVLGLTVVFLARVQAGMYFINSIGERSIIEKTKTQLTKDSLLFVIFFIITAVMLLLHSGVVYKNGSFQVEKYQFLLNFLANPIILILFLIGTISVLYAIYATLFKNSQKGIWFSGIGTVLVIFSVFCLIGYNNTSVYPSLSDLSSSLTIENSSGSHYGLSAMAYASLFIPFVLGYIILAWRSMNKDKITVKEVESDPDSY